MDFRCREGLGEIIYAYVVARNDLYYAMEEFYKFYDNPY